ncbi:hypothetical protein CEXT_767411 [Caerostris extrusa]|uniref:Uncharacterized protein n=1 Tax=Caerostris extrusa TaxID=172846 RepID=A0AAV4TIS4_CAEEX|nr:hypothetical protein CEXT_767411 [Caerostris extrusa]
MKSNLVSPLHYQDKINAKYTCGGNKSQKDAQENHSGAHYRMNDEKPLCAPLRRRLERTPPAICVNYQEHAEDRRMANILEVT